MERVEKFQRVLTISQHSGHGREEFGWLALREAGAFLRNRSNPSDFWKQHKNLAEIIKNSQDQDAND